MRFALLVAVALLSACAAANRLALVPPPGVDFSGHWKLNEADSDDPQRLAQAANNRAIGDPSSGGGGRGGGRGRGAGAGGGAPGVTPPATPSMGALGAGLRWPGKLLDVRQVGGVVAITSDGRNRVCQPGDAVHRPKHHSDPNDRDALPSRRDVPPPICGWSEKTLIVRSNDPDDDRPPFEEHYSLSPDGQRLIEEIGFKGGRSNGFTMSRVWDRVVP